MSPVKSLELSLIPQRRIGDGFPQTIVTFNEMLGTTGYPKNGVCLETLLSPSLLLLGCLWQLFSKLLTAVHIATPFASWYAGHHSLHGFQSHNPKDSPSDNDFCMENYLLTFACPLQFLLASFRQTIFWCVLSLLPKLSRHIFKKENWLLLR